MFDDARERGGEREETSLTDSLTNSLSFLLKGERGEREERETCLFGFGRMCVSIYIVRNINLELTANDVIFH